MLAAQGAIPRGPLQRQKRARLPLPERGEPDAEGHVVPSEPLPLDAETKGPMTMAKARQYWLDRASAQAALYEPTLRVGDANLAVMNLGLFATVPITVGTAIARYRGHLYATGPQEQIRHAQEGHGPLDVARYAVSTRRGLLDPGADIDRLRNQGFPPSDDYKASYANDCTILTAEYERRNPKALRQGARPCQGNNVVLREFKNGNVFLVTARDILAGEEIFVSYGSTYWGTTGDRLADALVSFLKRPDPMAQPHRWYTPNELYVLAQTELQLAWGGSAVRPKALEAIRDTLLRYAYKPCPLAQSADAKQYKCDPAPDPYAPQPFIRSPTPLSLTQEQKAVNAELVHRKDGLLATLPPEKRQVFKYRLNQDFLAPRPIPPELLGPAPAAAVAVPVRAAQAAARPRRKPRAAPHRIQR
jgi:hypothetical protein